MYTKKQNFFKTSIIISVSFILGITSTVLAAVVYDTNIQNRANKIFDIIKSNASTLNSTDASSYYNLVRMNISSLTQVLLVVDTKIAAEIGTIPGIDDEDIVDTITNTGTTSLSCLTRPSYLTPNNATFIAGTPTTVTGQTWQNTSSSSSCYYSCKTGYSGSQCTAIVATLSCLARPSYLTTTNTIFVDGTPTTTAQQTWQNTSSSSSCYYSCKSGYSGSQCAATTIATLSCLTRPSYLTPNNTTFVAGIPTTTAGQTWQNTSSSSSCYYSCKTGFSGTQCTSASTPIFNFTTAEYSVSTGTTIKINWYQMTNVESCIASGDWSGNKPVAGGGNGGSENILINAAKTFILTCVSSTGITTTKQFSITIKAPPENPPIDAVCGSLEGQSILRDTLNANTPNTCSVGKFIKTYQYNGGTQFEPYYDFLIENVGSLPAPLMPANYKYTCEGINGGKNAICRTGKIKENGVCSNSLNCTSGILKLTDEQDRYDSKKYNDGELNWECTGYSNGAMDTPTACKTEAFGQNPVCGSRFFQSSAGTTSLGSISYQAGAANAANYDFNPDIVCDLPDGVKSRKADFVTPIDLVGTDGKFDWKCSGVDRFGKPSGETVTCSVTRIFPGECGTNNGLTLNQVDSDSDFYQSWGGPVLLKYCKVGYPHYTDPVGTDGVFNWTCDISGAPKKECSANKGN